MTNDEATALFAANIRKRRETLGLTQRDLSQKTGIPQPDISDLEKGRRSPNLATITKLATALNVMPSYLLEASPLPVG